MRLNVGVDVSIFFLKNYEEIEWKQFMVGFKIWVVFGSKYDVWRVGEFELWDDKLQLGGVVFRDDGSLVKLGFDVMVLLEYVDDDGEGEDDEEEDGSDLGFEEEFVLSDYDEEFF